jgi:DNA-binding transcriptional MerR regulator
MYANRTMSSNKCEMQITEYGALELSTGRHILPKDVPNQRKLKDCDKGKYECPSCHSRVCIKQGTKVRHHFAHYARSGCSYYNQGSESDAHLEAKYVLQRMLTDGIAIDVRRPFYCKHCKHVKMTVNAYLELVEGDEVELEHVDGKNRYDVAVLRGGKLKYIFEIKHQHATTKPRPEPWFEFLAGDVINAGKEVELLHVKLECQRREFNVDCTCLHRYHDYNDTWLKLLPRRADVECCVKCNAKTSSKSQYYEINCEEKAICVKCMRTTKVEQMRVFVETNQGMFMEMMIRYFKEKEMRDKRIIQEHRDTVMKLKKLLVEQSQTLQNVRRELKSKEASPQSPPQWETGPCVTRGAAACKICGTTYPTYRQLLNKQDQLEEELEELRKEKARQLDINKNHDY